MKIIVSNEEIFILQKMVEGDVKAFKYFFDTYYEELCNFVNCYVRDEILSEDLVQSVFVYLWEKKDSLPIECSIKAYLYTASKNRSLNHLRDTKNKIKISRQLFLEPELVSTENAEQVVEFDELKEIISRAIDRLPGQCKIIYQLSRDKGLTNKEIAEKLGISLKTIENQITIANRKIKEYLQPYHDLVVILFLISIFS
jgi:RNA polymerase sigma-70 factor (ECF subfamily)